MIMVTLCRDLLVYIAARLHRRDIANFASACRKFNNAVTIMTATGDYLFNAVKHCCRIAAREKMHQLITLAGSLWWKHGRLLYNIIESAIVGGDPNILLHMLDENDLRTNTTPEWRREGYLHFAMAADNATAADILFNRGYYVGSYTFTGNSMTLIELTISNSAVHSWRWLVNKIPAANLYTSALQYATKRGPNPLMIREIISSARAHAIDYRSYFERVVLIGHVDAASVLLSKALPQLTRRQLNGYIIYTSRKNRASMLQLLLGAAEYVLAQACPHSHAQIITHGLALRASGKSADCTRAVINSSAGRYLSRRTLKFCTTRAASRGFYDVFCSLAECPNIGELYSKCKAAAESHRHWRIVAAIERMNLARSQ